MKIKNLYSFFTKLQTRIMNKTNIYHSQETKAKKKIKREKNHTTKQLTVKVHEPIVVPRIFPVEFYSACDSITQ